MTRVADLLEDAGFMPVAAVGLRNSSADLGQALERCAETGDVAMIPTERVMVSCTAASKAASLTRREKNLESCRGSVRARGAKIMAGAWPARAPKTNPSSRELLARRFAPWTPVEATSPARKGQGETKRPSRPVRTPPMA